MKTLLVICALSALIMHLNQDLNPVYWIGFIGVAITSLLIAKKLDYERAKRSNRKHL